MRIVVYPNTTNFVISDTREQPIFLAEDHPFQLSDAERIKITQIFLRQLPLCCLTQRAAKIVTAIFSQTIDFNKFEDDMNGRRLEQLTNLFPHHANEVVRTLEATHVLISRKGHYGKYLSINFNFSQWGKEDADGVITNDPLIILDKDREIFREKAENTVFKQEDTEKYSIEVPVKIAVTAPAQQPIQEEKSPRDYSHDLFKDMLIATGRIEEQVNDLSKKQDAIELFVNRANEQDIDLEKTIKRILPKVTQSLTAEVEKTVQRLVDSVNQPTEADLEKIIKRIVHSVRQPSAADLEKIIKRLINKALEEKQAKPVEAPTPTIPETSSETVIEVVIEPETDQPTSETSRPKQGVAPILPAQTPTENRKKVSTAEALRFPSQLSDDQCHDAKKCLQRVENDKEQILLDMLSKRLRNTSDPVKSPIAYLTNLVNLLATNNLDMPSTTGATHGIERQKPRPVSEENRRRAEYNEAVADCMHMEDKIKLLARKDSLTFYECLDKFDLRGLWRSIRDRFTETKEALAAIQPLANETMI